MDDDLGLEDDRDLVEDPDELLPYDQEGPGLFDEPLPDPEPACDIKAADGVVDDEPAAAGAASVEPVETSTPIEPTDDADEVGAASIEPVIDGAAAAPSSVEQAHGTVSKPDEAVQQDAVLAAPPAPPPSASPPPPSRPEAPLALYRRYRPDTFAEVIGQEHVTEPLARAIANNKVNHAYLFSGPRGCGKTTSARILARCLNCATGPTPTPCGVCDSCVALATGGPGSIDVIEIDAASHGRVDDARELREGVYFAPVSSRYKIYIIDEAHMVTKEGFNALLKVVEEPPEHVKFIFATTEPEKVIGTIRSRTHHYPFRLVPPRTLTSYLEKICVEEGVDVERGVLPLVVRAGAGSVRDSLSVLDQLLGAADHGRVAYPAAAALLGFTPDALLDEIVDAFAAGDGQGVFATIDKVIEVGQDPRRFTEDLLERMRDLVIVAQVPEAIESGLIDVSDDQAERLQSQASALGAGELTRAAEVIATGLTQMRGTTAPRLHLELICARVLLPNADADGRGLHARLDRLERRLDMPDLLPGRPSQNEPPASSWDDVPAAPAVEPPPARPMADPRPAQRPPSEASATQRPAVRPPAGQRPAPDEPPSQRPAPQAPPQATPATTTEGQPEPAPAASAAEATGPGTADLRRLWPQILEEVKTRKRFTHALLSQNAHVVEVRGRELVLGFANQGTLERFKEGGSVDVLRDCLIEVLGADLMVTAAVDGGPGAGAAQQRPGQRSAPARPAPNASPEASAPPAPDAQRRPDSIPEAPASRPPSPEPPPPEDDHANFDDVVLDDSGTDAAELLADQLGAQLLDEEEIR